MRALVVYESMFGNTEEIARDVAEGLAGTGADVTVAEVNRVRAADLRDRDLLVVGAPTHAFSLSRPKTREEAVQQGAPAERARMGVREWMTTLPHTLAENVPDDRWPTLAVFDTRVTQVRHLPGSAAKGAARIARAKGFEVVSRASFYVLDLSGPTAPGEQERARDWGAGLAAHVAGTGTRG